MPSQPTPPLSADLFSELANDLSNFAQSQQEQITSLQAEVQHLHSRLTDRDAVVQYQHDLLDKTQSDLIETRVKLQQAIQLAQPSVPTTVPTPNTSSPAEPPVRDVAASKISHDIDKVRLCNFNWASIDADLT